VTEARGRSAVACRGRLGDGLPAARFAAEVPGCMRGVQFGDFEAMGAQPFAYVIHHFFLRDEARPAPGRATACSPGRKDLRSRNSVMPRSRVRSLSAAPRAVIFANRYS